MTSDNENEEAVIEGEEIIENEEGIKDTVVEKTPVKKVKEEKVPSFL